MSLLQTKELCSRYIDTFGYAPIKPDHLISFAKQNGVKVLYKNVKTAMQSIQLTVSTPVKLQSHNKSKQVTEPTNNHKLKVDNEASISEITNDETDTPEHSDNDTHSTNDSQVAAHNKSTVTVCEPFKYPTQPINSPITSTQTSNDESGNYQMVVRRAHELDIIININSLTSHYTFDDYITYLCNNFNMNVTPTFLEHHKYDIMTHFSPICHRIITNLVPETKTLKYECVMYRIKCTVFGYIKNESSKYNLYVPSEIISTAISYMNSNDEKFSNVPVPNHYELQQCPEQIFKYGLFQKYHSIMYYNFTSSVKQISPIHIKMTTGYHSKNNYNSNMTYKMVCNVFILPLRIGSISGISECNKMDDDIIDETIKYFRANIFKKTFEIFGNADLVLIYLTTFISYSLRKLKNMKSKTEVINSMFYKSELNEKTKYLIKCPGDKGFPFDGKCYSFCKAKTVKEKDIFMCYFKQLRSETLKRLIDKCYYSNGLQNKHWFQFSTRIFLNIKEL